MRRVMDGVVAWSLPLNDSDPMWVRVAVMVGSGILGAFAGAWQGVGQTFQAFFWIMLIDTAVGVALAWGNGMFTSRTMGQKVAIKFSLVGLILAIYELRLMTNIDIPAPEYLAGLLAMREVWSIIEHIRRAGYILPEVFSFPGRNTEKEPTP